MKKRYIGALIILAAGSLLVGLKWNTWFHNPPEAAYTTPTTPDRIVLTTGEDLANSRTISWRCDTTITSARVEVVTGTDTLNITATGSIVKSRAGKSAFYTANLHNLQSNQEYKYRVANDSNYSSWYTFRTAEKESPISFVYIGDLQDKEGRSTGELLQNVKARFPDVDFWALGGDVIERPTDAYWSLWYSTIDSIAPEKPMLVTTGNHEYLKGLPKTLDARWTHTFSYPHNGPEDFEGRSYYINYKDLCYIVIDTDGIQGLPSLYAHRNWLQKVLDSSDKKWKIVMMHHPVYSVRAGRITMLTHAGRIILLTRSAFKSVFEKSNVNLVLQGHDHGYSRIATDSDNGLKCPVYVVSSGSPKCYDIEFDPKHNRLGSNLQLYQHITITGDTLQYKSYTHTHELYDDLIITADGEVTDRATEIPEKLELPPSYSKKGKDFIDKYNRKKQQYLDSKKH